MKRIWSLTLLIGAALVMTACPAQNNNNTPAYCPPGFTCVNGGVPNGQTVVYQGYLNSIVDTQAFILTQAFNGNVYNSGIVFPSGFLKIVAQGVNGTTNYNVQFGIYPQPSNPMFPYCVTTGVSCFNPVIVNATANPPSTNPSGGVQMGVIISPALRLNIIAPAGSDFNGTSTNITGVVINLVKNGQDPLIGGDRIANSDLTKYTY